MNGYNTNELYHYGVPGMKWGVRRAVQFGNKMYNVSKKHGYNQLQKQANRNEFRSKYHESKGHKLRAKYYDKKAFQNRDAAFDDMECMKASIKDLSNKYSQVAIAAVAGKTVVQSILNKR